MRIAIFDYLVTRTNPTGGCHLRVLEGLSREHEFTVFAARFDNPAPDRIKHVRVPAPRRPLALLFLAFYLMAPLAYTLERWRSGKFDVVQVIEGNTWVGRCSYTHFCHKAFLANQWPHQRVQGVRRLLRWLDHRLRAAAERPALRRAARVVVPSEGLRRELTATYPWLEEEKITVIPNAVELQTLERPSGFDRDAWRRRLGLSSEDLTLVFVGLGQWERKGLAQLLEALRDVAESSLKLVVVGGQRDVVSAWQKRAARLGVGERVRFAGRQEDVRPFLWSADAFVLPSTYEAHSLATIEAAAAGLPVMVPRIHGMEEIVEHGVTGFVLEDAADGIAAALRDVVALPADERLRLGSQARAAVANLSVDAFVARWRGLYERVAPGKLAPSPGAESGG